MSNILLLYMRAGDRKLYVHELHGVLFVTWCLERERALRFPPSDGTDRVTWKELVERVSGETLYVEQEEEAFERCSTCTHPIFCEEFGCQHQLT